MIVVKRIILNVLLVVAAILSGCIQSDNPVSGTQKIEYPQGGSTASAFIKVVDAYSKAPVKGALITIEGNGSCSTNVNGVARFNELRIGTYVVNASSQGYEPVTSKVTISADSVNSTIPLALQTTMDMQMCRRGVVIRGEVYYKKNGNLYPVSQNQVELILSTESSSFLQPVRIVKTLPNGSYFFDNVPEYTISFLQVKKYSVGGVYYSQYSGEAIYGGIAGDTISCAPVILTPEKNGFFTILSDNSDSIASTVPLKITFSEPVDTSKFNADAVTIYENSSSSGKVLLSTQWNKTLTVLAVMPYGGIWKDGSGYTVYFGEIYSNKGGNLYESSSYSFSVIRSDARSDVKNVRLYSTQTIDYYTSTVQIQWSRLSGATKYEVYCRVLGDSVWKTYASTRFLSDTLAQISTSGIFSIGKSLDVMVLGVYEDGNRCDPATAQILTIKDRIRPLITSGSPLSSYSIYDCNNTSSMSVTRQYSYPIQFSEPVDTTKTPVVTVKEASYSYYGDTTYVLPGDSIRCSWLTQTQLMVRAIIPALTNAAYDSIKVDLANVTDLSGNKVSFSDTLALPIVKYVTR